MADLRVRNALIEGKLGAGDHRLVGQLRDYRRFTHDDVYIVLYGKCNKRDVKFAEDALRDELGKRGKGVVWSSHPKRVLR